MNTQNLQLRDFNMFHDIIQIKMISLLLQHLNKKIRLDFIRIGIRSICKPNTKNIFRLHKNISHYVVKQNLMQKKFISWIRCLQYERFIQYMNRAWKSVKQNSYNCKMWKIMKGSFIRNWIMCGGRRERFFCHLLATSGLQKSPVLTSFWCHLEWVPACRLQNQNL